MWREDSSNQVICEKKQLFLSTSFLSMSRSKYRFWYFQIYPFLDETVADLNDVTPDFDSGELHIDSIVNLTIKVAQ